MCAFHGVRSPESDRGRDLSFEIASASRAGGQGRFESFFYEAPMTADLGNDLDQRRSGGLDAGVWKR